MSNPSTSQSSEDIRSDINQTRENMDQTIDALASRFRGRHLLDEVLGFFRSSSEHAAERASELKDRMSDSASRAVSAVADTVKRNPVPVALIGVGAAYLVYKSVKGSNSSNSGNYSKHDHELYDTDSPGYELSGDEYIPVDLDEYALRQSQESSSGQLHRTLAQAKSAMRSATETRGGKIRTATHRVGEKLREGTQTVRDRAGDLTNRVQRTTRKAYEQSRDTVVHTVQTHPVEVGLGLLAAGVMIGLALPTPRRVNQVVGPQADRLRRRARELGQELVERGRTVAHAAADAARKEAQAQGLSPKDSSSSTPQGSVAFAAGTQPGQTPLDGPQTSSAAEI
ncbi:MAG TPA: DUF3618 domain-containing protein [Opitutaceae bacterium]